MVQKMAKLKAAWNKYRLSWVNGGSFPGREYIYYDNHGNLAANTAEPWLIIARPPFITGCWRDILYANFIIKGIRAFGCI